MGSRCFSENLGRRHEGISPFACFYGSDSLIAQKLTCVQIAFVATLAVSFALANYAMGSIFIWRMNSELYPKPTKGAKQGK